MLLPLRLHMAYADGWLAPCGLKGNEDEDEKDDKESVSLTQAQPQSVVFQSYVWTFGILFGSEMEAEHPLESHLGRV